MPRRSQSVVDLVVRPSDSPDLSVSAGSPSARSGRESPSFERDSAGPSKQLRDGVSVSKWLREALAGNAYELAMRELSSPEAQEYWRTPLRQQEDWRTGMGLEGEPSDSLRLFGSLEPEFGTKKDLTREEWQEDERRDLKARWVAAGAGPWLTRSYGYGEDDLARMADHVLTYALRQKPAYPESFTSPELWKVYAAGVGPVGPYETQPPEPPLGPLPQLEEVVDWLVRRPDMFRAAAKAEIEAATWLCGRGQISRLEDATAYPRWGIHRVKVGLQESTAESTWVQRTLAEWTKCVTWYTEDPTTWWPTQADLAQMWLSGCSDMTGDAVLLLQGDPEQLLAASRGLVLATRPDGRRALVAANSMSDQLTPVQAACLLPGAIASGSYLVLEG